MTSSMVTRPVRRIPGKRNRRPAKLTPDAPSHIMRSAVARCTALVAAPAAVEIVTVSVAMSVPSGVSDAGAKLQLAPLGNPEQVNVTAWLNPPCGITATEALPDCPTVIESDGVTD